MGPRTIATRVLSDVGAFEAAALAANRCAPAPGELSISAATELDSSEESYSDMHDWLNVFVRKRIAKASLAAGTLPTEMAWVADRSWQG